MKIKTEIVMDGYELMSRFYDHYIEERDCADDFIEYHTMENGHWDDRLTDVVMHGMACDLYDFRFTFEDYANEKRKINNHNVKSLVAFVLTLEYFGMKNVEVFLDKSKRI